MSIYTAPIVTVEYDAPWRQKTQNKGDHVKIGGETSPDSKNNSFISMMKMQ
jgi:hypothetical protein